MSARSTINCPAGLDYNAPQATVVGFFAANRAENKLFSHTGLVAAPDVLDEVLDILGLASQPITGSSVHQQKEKTMRIVTRDSKGLSGGQPPTLKQGYYVTVEGIERLDITDDEGNTNTPIGDIGFEIAVPDVSYSGGSEDGHYHGLSMPAEEGAYTIKFRTGTDSIDIEVLKGVGNTSPNLAIRYIDLELPNDVECLLTFDPQGVPDLRYDSNGDGTYDVVVPAHVRVSGPDAEDVTAPDVSISFSSGLGSQKILTVDATDSQSGVGTIYYQLPGQTNFQVYTEPVSMPPLTLGFVRAFADDNVGNRSSPVKKKIPEI